MTPAQGHALKRDEIAHVRQEIEAADRALVALITRRCELARRIGAIKHAERLPVVDLAHEAAVLRRAGAFARGAGLDEETVRQIFWCLVALSRRAQFDEDR